MYPIAITVQACLQAGTRVDVAWTIEADGVGPRPPIEAVAFTPGGGKVGGVLDGALDARLAEHAALAGSGPGRVVEMEIGHVEALIAGVPPDGVVRAVVADAATLPAGLWSALAARRPLVLVTRLADGEVTDAEVFTDDMIGDAAPDVAAAFRSRATGSTWLDETSTGRLATVLWPEPQLVLAGGGSYAEAIEELATWLGWHVERVADAVAASALAAQLGPADAAVVVGHDHEVTGATILAALGGRAGYVGALGSPRVRQQRAAWLAERGTTDLDRLHTPAGLDLGSHDPREVALSVLAEAHAVRSGSTGRPLTEADLPSRTARGEQPPHRCT